MKSNAINKCIHSAYYGRPLFDTNNHKLCPCLFRSLPEQSREMLVLKSQASLTYSLVTISSYVFPDKDTRIALKNKS